LKEEKFTLSQYIDKGFWVLLLAVASYAASQIKEGSKSISELNEKMAVVVSQLGAHDRTLTDHEMRLRKSEQGKRGF